MNKVHYYQYAFIQFVNICRLFLFRKFKNLSNLGSSIFYSVGTKMYSTKPRRYRGYNALI